MILKRITLENIRSYTFQKIDFPEGSTMLAGDIGSGKSSVLLGLEFALFGVRRKHLPASSLLRNGENSGSVELHFMVDGKDIIIKRYLKRQPDDIKQDSGYMVMDGIRHDLTPVELKSRIISLLGYPDEELTKTKTLVYRYTVYTPQEEMRHILTEDKELRLNTLRKVFGIDKYKQIRENSQILLRTLRDRRNVLIGEVLGLDDKKKLMEQRESLLKEKDVSIRSLEEQKKVLVLQHEDLKIRFTEMQEKMNKREALVKDEELCIRQIKEKTSLVGSLKKQKDMISEEIIVIDRKAASIMLEDHPYDLAEVEKEISAISSSVNSAIQEKASLKERIINNQNKITEIQEFIRLNTLKVASLDEKHTLLGSFLKELEVLPKLNLLLEKNQESVKKLDYSIKEHEVSMNNSIRIKEKIKSLDSCPLCLQQVSHGHKADINAKEDSNIASEKLYIEKARAGLNIAELESKQIKEDIVVLEGKKLEAERLKIELLELKGLRQQLDEKEDSLKSLFRDQEENSRKLSSLPDTRSLETLLSEKRSFLKRMHDDALKRKEKENLMSIKAEKAARITSLETQIKDSEGYISSLGDNLLIVRKQLDAYSAMPFDDVREKLEKNTSLLKDTDIRLAEFHKESEGIIAGINMLKEEIAVKTKAKKNIERITQLQNWVNKFFINLMEVVEKSVMLKVYSEFNELFRRWFDILMEDASMSVRLDDEFTPVIDQNGYELEFSHLSGGERTSISLAYRLALNKVINDVKATIKTKDLIILDEPTDGFSSEQLDRVRDVLEQIGVKQTIIVSHESKIESYVDNVIRINKNEHISSVS